MEKREPSYTVGGNVNWCSTYEEQYGGSLKKKKKKEYRPTMSSSNPTPGCLFKENHNSKRLAQPYLQDMKTT